MKKIFSIAVFFLMVIGVSCKKSQPSGPAPEAAIVFITDANANPNKALSATFPVTVTLTSKIPSSSGINIAATVIDQTNNVTIPQNQGINSNTSINNIQLINLPRQHICSVTIKVTSVATPTNTASKTFEVVYK